MSMTYPDKASLSDPKIDSSASIYSSKVSGLAWVYFKNVTVSPYFHLMKSPGMYQTHSRLTSAIGMNRFREAINSTGKWG